MRLTELLGQVILRPLCFPPEILNYSRELLHETRQEDEKFNTNRVAELRRNLVGLKKYQDVAYEDRIRGIISETDWTEKYNKWKTLEFEYKAVIERLDAGKIDYNEQAIKIFEPTQDIDALYFTLPIGKKAELLKIVSSNSELDPVTLYPKWKKPFDLLGQKAFSSEWRGGRGSNSRPPA